MMRREGEWWRWRELWKWWLWWRQLTRRGSGGERRETDRYWGIVFIAGIMRLSIKRVWLPFDTDDATSVLRVTCEICSGRERRRDVGKKKQKKERKDRGMPWTSWMIEEGVDAEVWVTSEGNGSSEDGKREESKMGCNNIVFVIVTPRKKGRKKRWEEVKEGRRRRVWYVMKLILISFLERWNEGRIKSFL